VLECRSLDVAYGRLAALRNVSLTVRRGQIVSIVGGNGAGKTTLLRTISGLERSQRGNISFDGQDITNQDPAFIVRCGISHVPAGRQIFGNLTVMENLRLGAYVRTGTRAERAAVQQDLERAFELFPVLRRRTKQAGGSMSGGEQQMLAIARALMARPRLLLLDEPSLGLAPQILDGIFTVLLQLNRDDGLTILLVEQNAHLALDFASYAYVFETGSVAGEGHTQQLRDGDTVMKVYLGID